MMSALLGSEADLGPTKAIDETALGRSRDHHEAFVWFIIGGSSGIGRALVLAALSAQHELFLTARTTGTLQELAAPIRATLNRAARRHTFLAESPQNKAYD